MHQLAVSVHRMGCASSSGSWPCANQHCTRVNLFGQSESTATNASVGRSVHWMGCIFSFGAGWGSSQSISFCCWPLYFFFLFSFLFLAIFPGPDLTHSYPAHFPTLISIAPTLVPYLLSLTDTATLITSYSIDLAIVLTTYPTNLATLLITYPINLTIRFRVETHKFINKFFTNV